MLAPPSYPLTLVKRVIFSFILEVVNSPDSSLGQFTKALAPRSLSSPGPFRWAGSSLEAQRPGPHADRHIAVFFDGRGFSIASPL